MTSTNRKKFGLSLVDVKEKVKTKIQTDLGQNIENETLSRDLANALYSSVIIEIQKNRNLFNLFVPARNAGLPVDMPLLNGFFVAHSEAELSLISKKLITGSKDVYHKANAVIGNHVCRNLVINVDGDWYESIIFTPYTPKDNVKS